MVFWLSILASGLFVWLAIRIGFFETWTMLFNIVISVYLALFLTPLLLDILPAAGGTSYGVALTLAATATGSFCILWGISYVFLTGQFRISFPKAFEILFSGLLGFLAGFLASSFICLAITVAPVSQNRLVSAIGFNSTSQQPNISYICWWCDLVHSVVSLPENKITSHQAVDQLFKRPKPEILDNTNKKTDLVAPAEQGSPQTDEIQEDFLSPR
jgi:hypothetical protein